MSDKLRGYAHRVDVAVAPQTVWKALTQTEHLARWCSPGADIRAKPGGLFRASVDRMVELEAHIDVFDPARRLRLIYLPSKELPATEDAIVDDFILEPVVPSRAAGASGDSLRCAPVSTGTIVRLLGSGIPSTLAWDAQYKRLRMGWQAAMTRLKVFVERQMNMTGEAT